MSRMINIQKLFYFTFFWSFLACSNSQSPLSKNFPNTYTIPYKITDYDLRFTPTQDDILLAERLLREQLNDLNSDKINQGLGCPTIHKNLNKFARQYIGFINDEGEKIVWINAVWHTKVPEYFEEDVVFVLDGCSYYWQIEVNLKTKKVAKLQINGVS
jgi:hypothetical protein